MAKQLLHHLFRGVNPQKRELARTLKRFYSAIGLVYFGSVHQHDDEYDAIRGFSASLSHKDEHYAVGTYEGYDIRMVHRTDSKKVGYDAKHPSWTILEITLRVRNMPHIFFAPTGQEGSGYGKLFVEQPYMQPISSYASTARFSPEFHGRYQILARSTRAHDVESLLNSPIIVGIGARFWPYGIEVEHGRLYIYFPNQKLTKQVLESTLASAIWLADSLRAAHNDVAELHYE